VPLGLDLTPLRSSRDLRLLMLGDFVTAIGTQAALVALPFQIYSLTHSAFLTGLLGAVELGPLMAMALWGGALADRSDRRRLLLVVQAGLVVGASALAAVTLAGSPPVPVLFVLAGVIAGFGAFQNVVAGAIVPNLVAAENLRGALALAFGMHNLTMVIGPAVGGVLIGALGVASAYVLDAASCLAMVGAAFALSSQLPRGGGERDRESEPLGVLSSIAEGLRFVRGNRALMGSFVIDLCAMTFGMPRALFPVLAVSVYHAGAAGTGAMFAAVSAGAAVAALTASWLPRVRRLGRIVIAAVIVWGGAIAVAGLASTIYLAVAMLAVAGAADSVSAVCRSSINQMVTPDAMRGRMSSVFSVVVTSGPRLGDVEAGSVAALAGVRASVVSGGLACIAGVGLTVLAFPALAAFDAERDAVGAQPALALQ
jgi:MFS family permease